MYEKLVKSLRNCVADDNGCCFRCPEDCNGPCQESLMKQAADAIESVSKAYQMMAEAYEREVTKQNWIPVTERLPNCNGCYLVWRPHFFGGEVGMPSICYFDGSNTWHDSYGVDFGRTLHSDDVTHWMPLPEPPKEET